MLLTMTLTPLLGMVFALSATSRNFSTTPPTPSVLQGLPEVTPFNGRIVAKGCFFYIDLFFPLDGNTVKEKSKLWHNGIKLAFTSGKPFPLRAAENSTYLYSTESGLKTSQKASAIKVWDTTNSKGKGKKGDALIAIINVYPVDADSHTRKVTCLLWDKSFTASGKEFIQKYGEAPLVESPSATPAQATVEKTNFEGNPCPIPPIPSHLF